MEMKDDSSKRRGQLTQRHGVTAQNIWTLNNTDVKTSNIAGY